MLMKSTPGGFEPEESENEREGGDPRYKWLYKINIKVHLNYAKNKNKQPVKQHHEQGGFEPEEGGNVMVLEDRAVVVEESQV